MPTCWENASDLALARLELRHDPIAAYLDDEQCAILAQQALEMGSRAALQVVEEHGTVSPLTLATRLGVEVVHSSEPQIEGYRLRAAYERVGAGGRLILYTAEVREMAQRVAPLLQPPPTAEQFLAAIVAHELFHHLEETEFGRLSEKVPSVTTFRLGSWRVRRRVQRVREIGAHRFAKSITGLSYLPSLWDYLQLVTTGKILDEDLRNELFPLELKALPNR